MGPRVFHHLQHPQFSTISSPLTKAASSTSQLQARAQINIRTHDSLRPLFHHHHCLHDDPCCPGDPFRDVPSSVLLKKYDVADDGQHAADDEQLLRTLCQAGHLSQAIYLLSHMQTSIHNSNYMALLKACITCMAPAYARQVYAHLTQYSNEITPLLGDYLAVTFAKCRAIDDASRIFHALSHRTILSWTAMISAFIDCGYAEEALQMSQFMQLDSVEPDSYMFVSLFKACGNINDLKQGRRLHTLAHEKGFTSNVFVGNTLVTMYGKCGDVLEAEEVFRVLPKRNNVSWNAMLSVFIEDGQIENALLLYRQIHEELMDTDWLALVFALQACGSLAGKEIASVVERKLIKLMSLDIGQALHSLARMRYYESDMFVATALINMYGKCGAIREAQHVFAALSQHDVVSWNAMMSAYAQQIQGQKALQLYVQMATQGLSPDECTYVLVFQVCGSSVDKEGAVTIEEQLAGVNFLEIGQALHSEACKQGLALNLAVGNSLVSMYRKHGMAMEAEHVFSVMFEHDVVSWSMMLSVHVDHGRGKKALQLYRQMLEEGVSPDQHVLASALQACAILLQEEEALIVGEGSNQGMPQEIGKALLVDARMKGVSIDLYVGNALINLYGKCVGLAEAQDVFVSLSEWDVVAWTTMLSTYVEHGQARKALQFYKVMHEECVAPDKFTFVIALQACSILVDSEKALVVKDRTNKLIAFEIVQALHSDAYKEGYMTDALVWNTLVTTYGKCGSIVEAENLFNTLSHHDVAAWNAMLSGYLEHGKGNDILRIHREMQKQHAILDYDALIKVLHACSDAANLEMCRELHFYAASGGYVPNFSLATTLIHAYGNCASMEDMQAACGEVCRPDTVAWTACVAGNAELGNFIASADVFERSRVAGMKPDEAILTTMLLACGHSGFVIEGLEYFISARKEFGVTPNLRHYGIMVDLLGRSGDFKRVEDILKRTPMQADLMIWSSLLSACHIHGNVELAKWAFKYALLLEPIQASLYVTMSNACTDARQDEGAAELEYHTTCLQEE